MKTALNERFIEEVLDSIYNHLVVSGAHAKPRLSALLSEQELEKHAKVD